MHSVFYILFIPNKSLRFTNCTVLTPDLSFSLSYVKIRPHTGLLYLQVINGLNSQTTWSRPQLYSHLPLYCNILLHHCSIHIVPWFTTPSPSSFSYTLIPIHNVQNYLAALPPPSWHSVKRSIPNTRTSLSRSCLFIHSCSELLPPIGPQFHQISRARI